jgi:glycosyltransferase involved in cell wall biosynthesis
MTAPRRLNLVALNWRDIRNPEAGGAEVHLHEILTRMVARGHAATLFATRFAGAPDEEAVDGIRVIRRGSWWNANFVLARAAAAYLRDNPASLINEDINKIPFFMPRFTRLPVMPVIPHLFGTTVFRETNPVFASYVYLWERFIPRVYRNCRFVVISPSTRDDLVARGVRADHVDVVLCGLDHDRYRVLPGAGRDERPTIVHLGRARRYKAIDVVIRAFARVRGELPDARLVVIGGGPELPALKELARRLGLEGAVEFTGHMPAGDIVLALNRCHVVLNASPKEGWGLTVVEANACGAPVVGSNSPGLRDSIRDGETGFLVPPGDVEAFAQRALQLLRDDPLRARMSAAALAWAGSLTWERTAREMEALFMRDAV